SPTCSAGRWPQEPRSRHMLYRHSLSLATLMLLTTATPAQAHRLLVKPKVLPDNRILIVAQYSTGEWAAGGGVRVYRANGELLAPPGVLDEKGSLVFWYPKAEDLRIEVLHDGHPNVRYLNAADLLEPSSISDQERRPAAFDWT